MILAFLQQQQRAQRKQSLLSFATHVATPFTTPFTTSRSALPSAFIAFIFIALIIAAILVNTSSVLGQRRSALLHSSQSSVSSKFREPRADTVRFQIDMRRLIADKRFDVVHDTIGVRGGIPPLDWNTTLKADDRDGDGIYTATIIRRRNFTKPAYYTDKRFPYKFKIDSPAPKVNDGWELGNNSSFVLSATGMTVVEREFGKTEQAPLTRTITGTVIILDSVPCGQLPPRPIAVYLPPRYAQETALDTSKRYPVLYMHDGQNIFDDYTASGSEWHLDEIAQALILNQEIQPIIIVGVYNMPEAGRINEYTPTQTIRPNGAGRSVLLGGKADAFGEALVQHIKPFIDRTYRTLPDAAHTALGGSSLGGLSTLYHGLKRPDVFGNLLVVSPSLWWDNKFIINQMTALKSKPQHRVWIDMGRLEGPEAMEDLRRIRLSFVNLGYELGRDWQYVEDIHGRHDEASWAARVEPMLKFLYGIEQPPQQQVSKKQSPKQSKQTTKK